MKPRLFFFLSLITIAATLASCNEDVVGQYDVLEGTYISTASTGVTSGSQLELTVIKTFQTKFSFYLIFKGSIDVIEIPGVEFSSDADKITYSRSDVDSDIEIEGSFLKDGASGEIAVKLGDSTLNFDIEKT